MVNISKEQKLQHVVDAFRQYVRQRQGCSIIGEKDLKNGHQLLVTDGRMRVSVDCFTTGNALIQGSEGTLRTELQTWWKQQKEASTGLLENIEPPSSSKSKIEAFQLFATQQGWSVAGNYMHNGIYQLRINSGGTSIPVNFYPTGTVLIQGNPGAMKQTLEEWWERQRNDSSLSLWEEASFEETFQPSNFSREKPVVRRIGIHEAGSSDFFGPLVIVGLYVDEQTETRLIELGVRESAWLPMNIILSLADDIKEVCRGCGYLRIYQPEQYNRLYQELSDTDLLRAQAYAHVIAKLREQHPCEYAVIQPFADKAPILQALQALHCPLPLEQDTESLSDASVAAASILARAECVQQISKLSKRVGFQLPSGISNPDIIPIGRDIVARGGRGALGKVAKLHFEITQKICE